jgi:hypothetical protein
MKLQLLGSHRLDFRDSPYWGILLKAADLTQFPLKFYQNNGYLTQGIKCVFLTLLRFGLCVIDESAMGLL